VVGSDACLEIWSWGIASGRYRPSFLSIQTRPTLPMERWQWPHPPYRWLSGPQSLCFHRETAGLEPQRVPRLRVDSTKTFGGAARRLPAPGTWTTASATTTRADQTRRRTTSTPGAEVTEAASPKRGSLREAPPRSPPKQQRSRFNTRCSRTFLLPVFFHIIFITRTSLDYY
jgi:hypothetical protein